MTDTTCRCGKPTRDDAYVCEDCLDTLARALGDVPWLAEELDTTVARQSGVDYRRLGGASGGKKPAEMPSPANMGASDARTALKSILVSWVMLCHEEHVRHRSSDENLPADNLNALSRWMLWRVDGLALHEAGSDAVEEIESAVANCRRHIDRAPDRWYAGPCNYELEGVECGADLYALSAQGKVDCRVCGAQHDVAARRTWLLLAAEDRLADATTLARSVSWLGAKPLNAARVRQWAARGRIVAKGSLEGRPVYRIGDAIDLLAQDAS